MPRRDIKTHEKQAKETALNRLLCEADVPKEDRGLALLALIRSEGGLHQKFENCPICGRNRLPVEAHSGLRRCRNCGHYGQAERAVA